MSKALFHTVAILVWAPLWFGCTHRAPNYGTQPARFAKLGVVAVDRVPIAWPAMVQRSLQELYGGPATLLPGAAKSAYPIPSEALRDAGVRNLDHVFVLTGSKPDRLDPMRSVTVSFVDLGTMATAFQFPLQETRDAARYFKLALSEELKDPDQRPRGKRSVVADELERRGEFEMARDVLRAVRDEYGTGTLFDIAQRGELEQKLTDLDRSIEAQECFREDERAVFDFDVANQGIADPYFRIFRQILAERNTRTLLTRYSVKPTHLRINYDAEADRGEIRLRLRFVPTWYAKATSTYPVQIRNKRVVSFRPYVEVTQELIALRQTFASRLPAGISQSVLNFQTILTLEKPCGQFLEFAVTSGPQQEGLDPDFLAVKVQGYDEVSMKAADRETLHETGMFALGPSKLLSGQRTVYGVVYDFLELKE